jgi:drug/metabolite transporter (DMT)-like permease
MRSTPLTSTPSTASRSVASGTLFGVGCAFSYGLTVVFGRRLATSGFKAPTVLGTRFGIAAIATLLLLQVMRKPLLPAPGERVRVFLLGAIGYAFESSCFFAGLERGSAAAVALIFYCYPAIVTIVQRDFSRRSALTIALSTGGTVLIVTAGGGVDISNAGVAFALLAAFSFAGYLIAGHRLVDKTDSLTTAAWVAAGTSMSLVLRGVVTSSLQSPGGYWPSLIGNGLASASAFALMFAALRRIGPRRTGIVMTLEAAFAVVLAAIFLDETIGGLQLVGGAAILAATTLTGLEREDVAAEA